MASAVVVDANVIFSSLLSDQSRLRKVLLTGDLEPSDHVEAHHVMEAASFVVGGLLREAF